MKKLLIATAAMAVVAGAQAQSSVTVYGIMDLGYATTQNDATAAGAATVTTKTKTTGNGDGALSTSRLGFKGSEDLGAGNKANFVLEYDLVDAGTGGQALGARYSWVGLESKELGQLRLGRQEQAIHSVVVGGSAGGANNMAGTVYSAGGPVSPNAFAAGFGVANFRPHAVFVDRAVTYISPSFSGLTVELQTAHNSTTAAAAANNTSVKETGASVKYVAGKLNLAYGQAANKVDAATPTNDTEVKSSALSGSYDLGVVKLFALQSTRDNITNGASQSKDKNTEIGVQAPVNAKTVVWASMFDGDRKYAPTATKAENEGYQVGVRYDLSKRTSLYAIYGTQSIEGTGTVAGNKDENTGTAVGVRHSF